LRRRGVPGEARVDDGREPTVAHVDGGARAGGREVRWRRAAVGDGRGRRGRRWHVVEGRRCAGVGDREIGELRNDRVIVIVLVVVVVCAIVTCRVTAPFCGGGAGPAVFAAGAAGGTATAAAAAVARDLQSAEDAEPGRVPRRRGVADVLNRAVLEREGVFEERGLCAADEAVLRAPEVVAHLPAGATKVDAFNLPIVELVAAPRYGLADGSAAKEYATGGDIATPAAPRLAQ
jgi:hypothetical protein